jgi:HPt (histidine-containing phosphotransfer) domain-containing protein
MNGIAQQDSITVEVDSEVESIVPAFLESRRKDCQLISDLLNMSEFSEIRILGHRMKGAGGSYGFDDISEIGEDIEKAALSGDTKTIAGAVIRLSHYLDRVVVVYV